jgi:hypothetical protein
MTNASVITGTKPIQFQRVENAPVMEYDLQTRIFCVDWNPWNGALAYGHALGVGILAPEGDNQFKASFQHLGMAALTVKFNGDYLAAVHPDFSMSQLSLATGDIKKLEGRRGHSSFVNAVDVSSDGTVVSVGDDKFLLVWAKDQQYPRRVLLAGAGRAVKLWNSSDGDRVVVLESDNHISVFDLWRTQCVANIYVGMDDGLIQDIGVHGSQIIVVGVGWWKAYDMSVIVGGCGYTPPSDEGRLVGCNHAGLLRISGDFVGHGCPTCLQVYDLSNAGEHGVSVNYNMGVSEVSCLCLDGRGEMAALTSGSILAVYKRQEDKTKLLQ